MLKFQVLFIIPILLFLGCGGYESKEVFYVDKCGGKEYNTSTQFCENGNIKNIFHRCQDSNYDHSIQYCYDGVVKDKEIFADERDGKTYKYVIIGEQTWMAENLNYDAPNSRCYDDNPDNCEIFGKLYDWETAKTVCPSGWHLPDDYDFTYLKNFVEATSRCSDCAGIVLKANSALWVANKGTDEFGFTALPGGYYREYTGGFNENKIVAGFWSATEGIEFGSVHFRYFKSINNSLNLAGFYIDRYRCFANVRCIKDFI